MQGLSTARKVVISSTGAMPPFCLAGRPDKASPRRRQAERESGAKPGMRRRTPQTTCAGRAGASASHNCVRASWSYYLTLTSLISNCTATFGGNGVRGSAP
ncbi:hypothetical protein [Lysobacter gummosus]|uniref:hypothetical protein n=1 Tax=Lysobacter gummosus TaxID=262324 RepID=UPI003639B1D4